MSMEIPSFEEGLGHYTGRGWRWIVEFEDADVTFTSGEILGLEYGSYIPVVDEDSAKVGSVSLEPLDGRTSIGSAELVLTDKDQIVSDMLALAFGFYWSRVKIKLGFADLKASEFKTLFKGRLRTLQWLDSQTAYSLQFVDALGLLKQNIFTTATAGAPVHLVGAPIELALKILMSSGTLGKNGVWDVLPAGQGLDLDPSQWVSVADMLAQQARWIPGVTMEFWIRKPEDAFDFIANELMRPIGAYLHVNDNWKIACDFISPAIIGQVTVPLNFGEDYKQHPTITQTLDGTTINDVVFAWDHDSASDGYATAKSFPNEDLRLFHGKTSSHQIGSRGLRSNRAGLQVARDVAERILSCYGFFQSTVPLSCGLLSMLRNPGQAVILQAPKLPTASEGRRTVRRKNVGKPHRRVAPRFCWNAPDDTPDYLQQTEEQRVACWSVCGSGTNKMPNGDPGYAMLLDGIPRVEVLDEVLGVTALPLRILTRDVDVKGETVSLECRGLAVDPLRRYAANAPDGLGDYSSTSPTDHLAYWFVTPASTGRFPDGGGYAMI